MLSALPKCITLFNTFWDCLQICENIKLLNLKNIVPRNILATYMALWFQVILFSKIYFGYKTCNNRPMLNMLKIWPKMFSGISQNFHPLYSFSVPIMLVLCS